MDYKMEEKIIDGKKYLQKLEKKSKNLVIF